MAFLYLEGCPEVNIILLRSVSNGYAHTLDMVVTLHPNTKLAKKFPYNEKITSVEKDSWEKKR